MYVSPKLQVFFPSDFTVPPINIVVTIIIRGKAV